MPEQEAGGLNCICNKNINSRFCLLGFFAFCTVLMARAKNFDQEELISPMQNKSKSQESIKEIATNEDDEMEDPSDEEQEMGNGELTRKRKPHMSHSTINSSKEASRGRELNESWLYKFKFIIGTLFSLIINILVFFTVLQLYSENGFVLSFGDSSFNIDGAILFLLFAFGTFIFTEHSMKQGASAYYATKLTEKRGYSIALRVFIQSNLSEKQAFSSALSSQSKVKNITNRLGILWGLHALSLIFAILAGTQIFTKVSHVDLGNLSCLIYHVNGTPTDRDWPTVDVGMGVGEYVFGASLGILSSQDPVEKTTFVMAPQLIDATVEGTTLFGKGLIHTIQTSCNCAYSEDETALVAAGILPENFASTVSNINILDTSVGLVNSVEVAEGQVIITSALTGTAVCGRTNTASQPIPVCKTAIYDPHLGIIQIAYMTDGSSGSVAPERVQIREQLEPYDIAWLEHGFKTLFGDTGYVRLPPTFPGSINPLLWWTSSNMQSVSPSSLEKGIETTFAILSKLAIQRTYRTGGDLCSQNRIALNITKLHTTIDGLMYGIIFACIQFIANIAALAGFIPWFLSKTPVFPAYRLFTDNFYFALMMSKPHLSGLMGPISLNDNRDAIWNSIDTTLRMGEAILTVEDPETGELTLDRPKMVAAISVNKIYH
jgi:hypothetical protein